MHVALSFLQSALHVLVQIMARLLSEHGARATAAAVQKYVDDTAIRSRQTHEALSCARIKEIKACKVGDVYNLSRCFLFPGWSSNYDGLW